MADDGDARARWVDVAVLDELQRFRSLRRRPGRVPRFTPMPPEVWARFTKELGAFWPLAQSTRDDIVSCIAQRISGSRGSLPRRHGFIPEPEATGIAVAAEAEGFAAASAYAADKSVATDEERCNLYRKYVKEVWGSVYRYEASRAQAAGGTSRSGPAAQPPTVAVVSGLPSASAPHAGSSRSRGRRPRFHVM